MTRRKGKTVSFDAMVKFFMQQYGIPTKKDLDKLVDRMDRLEKVISNAVTVSSRYARNAGSGPKGRSGEASASDIVLDIISKSKEPIGIPEIREKTGFGDKKLRNIIFRLYKNGTIARKQRGRYVAS
jgi:predicted transcriptional regulator